MKMVVNTLAVVAVLAWATTASAQYSAGGGAIQDTGSGCSDPGSSSTVFPTIEIAGEAGTVIDNVGIEGLQHTWAGDLEITLDGPLGSTTLLDRPGATGGVGCGTGSDFVAGNSYGWSNDGVLFPEAPGDPIPGGDYAPTADGGVAGSPIPSGNLNGTWSLTIRDWSGLDTGSIGGWSIDVVPEPSTIGLLAIGGLTLLRRRR